MKLTLVLALLGGLAGTASAFNACKPCLALVGFIETEVTRDEGEEDKILDAACAKEVPAGFLVKACDTLVNTALKYVVAEIDTKQPPAKVCSECHLCSSAEAVEALVGTVDAGLDPSQLCKILPIIKDLINKALGTKQAKQVCKIISGKFGLSCKDVEADLEKALAALESACPSSDDFAAVTAFAMKDGAFDPKELCPLIPDLEQLANKAAHSAIAKQFCLKVAKHYHLSCKDVAKDLNTALQAFKQFCQSGAEEEEELVLAPVEMEGEFNPAKVCAFIISEAEQFVKKFFNNKYAAKYCKELAKMAKVDVTCKDVKKDMKKAIKALKAKCPASEPESAVAVEATAGGFDPSQLCGVAKEALQILNSGDVDKACAFLEQEVKLPANFCKQVATFDNGLEKLLQVAVQFCGSSMDVSVLGAQTPCSVAQAALAALEDAAKKNPAVAALIPYAKQIVAKVCASGPMNRLNMAQHAVLASDQLCSVLATVESEVKAMAAKCAGSKQGPCKYLAQAEPVLKYLAGILGCPSSSAVSLDVVSLDVTNDDWCDIWRDLGAFAEDFAASLKNGGAGELSKAEVAAAEAFCWLLVKLAHLGDAVNSCPAH